MPRSGDIDTTYPDKLKAINIELLEQFRGAKIHHKMRCLRCQHEWIATPLSKLQNHRRWKKGGCPACTIADAEVTKKQIRQNNIKRLQDRGLEILSNWDGASGTGKESKVLQITVRNKNCGHTFTSNSKNLLNRGITCAVCGRLERTANINHWSELNSARWRQTATDWQLYKSKVTKLTRKAYIANKDKINPNDLPKGRAGTEGAHHLDHIVPIRYCFENNVPVDLCADSNNLQMLKWLDNVHKKDRVINKTPDIFNSYKALTS